jgi:hypothetical protein
VKAFDTSGPMPRNPWRGISMWKEFKYDMRHPKQNFKRSIYGIKGQNPLVTKEERFLGFCFLVAGGLQLIIGLAAIIVALL